jgi:hypothetical protein
MGEDNAIEVKRTTGDVIVSPGSGICLATVAAIEWFAKKVVAANWQPKGMNEAGVTLVLLKGAELSISPFQALGGIMCVNNHTSVWGDLALALCRRNRDVCEYVQEEFSGTIEDENFTAICHAKRKGEAEIARSYSVADAKRARLWNKQGSWQTDPGRMLQMRARAFALRDAFADLLQGLSIIEEQQDVLPPIDVTDSVPNAIPRTKAELKARQAITAQSTPQSTPPPAETQTSTKPEIAPPWPPQAQESDRDGDPFDDGHVDADDPPLNAPIPFAGQPESVKRATLFAGLKSIVSAHGTGVNNRPVDDASVEDWLADPRFGFDPGICPIAQLDQAIETIRHTPEEDEKPKRGPGRPVGSKGRSVEAKADPAPVNVTPPAVGDGMGSNDERLALNRRITAACRSLGMVKPDGTADFARITEILETHYGKAPTALTLVELGVAVKDLESQLKGGRS